MINNFLYNNRNEDEEEFLSKVPLTLLKENLLYQIKHPTEDRKVDFLAPFIKGYEYSKSIVEDDEDKIELMEMRDSFLKFYEELVSRTLGIVFPNLYDIPENEQNELIHFSYRFFIMQMRSNFVNLICNYITEHMSELYENGNKRKDVSATAYKKELGNTMEAGIIANLSTIIDKILYGTELDVDDFLKLSQSEYPSMENTFVQEKYDEFEITGNFVTNYPYLITADMKLEIESRVRSKLLRKFRINANGIQIEKGEE